MFLFKQILYLAEYYYIFHFTVTMNHQGADKMKAGKFYPSHIYEVGFLIQKACDCLYYPYSRMTATGTISSQK